jgi:uncharacterized protein (TIGR03435 family)
MQRAGSVAGIRKELLMCAGVFAAAAAPIVFGLVNATPGRAQAQTQSQTQTQVQSQAPAQTQGQTTPLDLSKFEYEVASFKPNKGDGSMTRIQTAPDAFTGSNITLQMLVTMAYGIQNYQLEGAPSWLSSERFDVDAKIESSVADSLKNLSADDRNLARQHMMQALLADRLKLTIRRESKELPVYLLVIGKNGSKLKEAKPADPNANPAGPQGPGGNVRVMQGPGGGGGPGPGRGGPGMMMTSGRGGTQSMAAQAMPISGLVRMLAGNLGRPVIDKTGLTGNYDFKLEWAPEQNQAPTMGGDGAPTSIASSDPAGPTLLMAVQDQLGLKLESGKGPVEIIVIQHVQRPSDN